MWGRAGGVGCGGWKCGRPIGITVSLSVCLTGCVCFVRTISCEELSLSQPNVVRWCISMSRRVVRNNWIVVFKIKVTIRVQSSPQSVRVSFPYSLTCSSFCRQTWYICASWWAGALGRKFRLLSSPYVAVRILILCESFSILYLQNMQHHALLPTIFKGECVFPPGNDSIGLFFSLGKWQLKDPCFKLRTNVSLILCKWLFLA